MKTLAKIIRRLLFGPSLEDYEARQKVDTVKAFKAIYESSTTIKPAMSEQQRRQADLMAILKLQADTQRHLIQQQAKYIDYLPPYRQEVFQNIRIKA